MAAPRTGTCEPWATEADLCSPCNDYEQLGPIAGDYLQMATDVLYELSGRQFPGQCTDTVRPCVPSSSCGCRSDCTCLGSRQIELGVWPLVAVSQVKLDGVVLDSGRYRVDDYRYLVRLPDADGTNPGWPTAQRLDLGDDQQDTWSVTFSWGLDPPTMGVKAAAVLACELALACDPENADNCRLPKSVTSVTREGVTLAMTDLGSLLSENRTGIPEVDLFLRASNPHRLRRRASAWSPDTVSTVRRVGT